jgi:hypothetical protein
MPSFLFRVGAILVLAAASGWPADGWAQPPSASLCGVHAAGLVTGMRKAVDLQQPLEVAVQHAGLAPGGPRQRMAQLAHRLFVAGTAEPVVRQRVTDLCLSMDRQALLDDKPTFDTRPSAAGAQVCSDVASTVAGFLSDPAGRSLPLDSAFAEYTSGRAEEGSPLDTLRAAFERGYVRARQGADARAVASTVMSHCSALPPAQRARLDEQFYVR